MDTHVGGERLIQGTRQRVSAIRLEQERKLVPSSWSSSTSSTFFALAARGGTSQAMNIAPCLRTGGDSARSRQQQRNRGAAAYRTPDGHAAQTLLCKAVDL